MVAPLSRHIDVFSDGTYKVTVPYSIPNGYFLAQLKDDFAVFGEPRTCSYGGCPSVVPLLLDDRNDAFFTKDWQYHLVAINWEIYKSIGLSSIMALMGSEKSFMNGTGIDNQRNNYLSGKTGYLKDPATEKFRSMNLNTHMCRESGDYYIPVALDGTQPPRMKINPSTGRSYSHPQTLDEINPDHYFYHPRTHRWLYLDCTNVKWKPDTSSLDYGPYDKGAVREWMTDGLQHTFFPFITSRYPNTPTPKSWWRRLADGERIPSAIRRG